jgi:hypothetical protein
MDTKMRLATSIVIILDVAKELGIIRAQGQYLKKREGIVRSMDEKQDYSIMITHFV